MKKFMKFAPGNRGRGGCSGVPVVWVATQSWDLTVYGIQHYCGHVLGVEAYSLYLSVLRPALILAKARFLFIYGVLYPHGDDKCMGY